ncbi:MAG: HAMP domain-containing histidine kinase [Firmicutes bacterium]|nr:HAMP domain-containing histidine kinase [Bacillota bacterium]
MNSIFKKQFLFYTGILVLSFSVFGIGLTQAFSSYFVQQRKDMLIEQGRKISNVFEQAYYMGGLYDRDKLNSEIEILNEYWDVNFIYVDHQSTIVIISNNLNSDNLGKTVDAKIVELALEGNVVSSQGTLGGIFSNSVLMVGYPVKVGDYTVGAIFMTSPMTELQETKYDSYRIIIIGTCIAIIIGFLLISVSSLKMTQPLMQLNKAAKEIASGDFEKRLDIKSNDEIEQLAESFNEMAESLYEQERRRREFISNISHDLRSPLTSMRGFLQAIIDGTIPEEKVEHYLNIILDESDRLAIMANNILDINKLESPEETMKYSEFDINDLLRDTVRRFEERVAKKDIKVNISFAETETIVKADIEKIQRVIYNLMDNAIKFLDIGGTIDIITRVKEKKVYISVMDNGRGISRDDQKRIFDRFYKVDTSRGKDKKGSGLGLSIVKDFVKLHGESIKVNSEPNKGCEFVFTLTKI